MKYYTKLTGVLIFTFISTSFISCDEVRKQVVKSLATDEEKKALEQSETKKDEIPHFDPYAIKKAKDAMTGTVTISNAQKIGDGRNYQISADINNNTNKDIIKIILTISSYDTSRDMFDTSAYNYDKKTIDVSISSYSSHKINCSTILGTEYSFDKIMLDRVIFSDGEIMDF